MEVHPDRAVDSTVDNDGDYGVSFTDCFDDIVARGGDKALWHYESWANNTEKLNAGVVPFVQSLRHVHLFKIQRAEILAVRSRMAKDKKKEHALEGSRSSDVTDDSKNLNTPWAYIHLFHMYIEEKRSVPTWQEWRTWLVLDVPEKLVEPIRQKFNWSTLSKAQRDARFRELRWRVGLAYYGMLRELDVFVRLREMGIPVKYHVLADALFAVDMWCGNNVVSVFASNTEMKDGNGSGRKPLPEDHLSRPPFTFRNVKVRYEKNAGLEGGIAYFVDDESVQDIAKALVT